MKNSSIYKKVSSYYGTSHFCQFAKDVERSISTEKEKTNKAYKDTNAETVASDSCGLQICQEEISLAA